MIESAPQAGAGLDELLDRLEEVIGRLSDPAAPLDRLVTDHEAAWRLVEAAGARLEAAEGRVAAEPTDRR